MSRWYIPDHGPSVALAISVWTIFVLFSVGDGPGGDSPWKWLMGPLVNLFSSYFGMQFWKQCSVSCRPIPQSIVSQIAVLISVIVSALVNSEELWVWIYIILGFASPVIPTMVSVLLSPSQMSSSSSGVTLHRTEALAIGRGGKRFAQALSIFLIMQSVSVYEHLGRTPVVRNTTEAYSAAITLLIFVAIFVSPDSVSQKLRQLADTAQIRTMQAEINQAAPFAQVELDIDNDTLHDDEDIALHSHSQSQESIITAAPDLIQQQQQHSDTTAAAGLMQQQQQRSDTIAPTGPMQQPEATATQVYLNYEQSFASFPPGNRKRSLDPTSMRSILLVMYSSVWMILVCESTVIMSLTGTVAESACLRIAFCVTTGVWSMMKATEWGWNDKGLPTSFNSTQMAVFILTFFDILVQVFIPVDAVQRVTGLFCCIVLLLFSQRTVCGLVTASVIDTSNSHTTPTTASRDGCFKTAFYFVAGIVAGYTIHRTLGAVTIVHPFVLTLVIVLASNVIRDGFDRNKDKK